MATLENYVHFVHPKIHISCSHGYQLVGKEENAALRRISDPTNKFKKCGCGAQTSPALSPVPVLDLAENYSTAEQGVYLWFTRVDYLIEFVIWDVMILFILLILLQKQRMKQEVME
ncbi:Uncharacterized protein Fot_27103 [Forsythia ovata]|uniref:Uncharacterized protein n=1 Tax=Forsythia ovata TaxID=205694 RepID=A0ABD1UDV8_9LAMI